MEYVNLSEHTKIHCTERGHKAALARQLGVDHNYLCLCERRGGYSVVRDGDDLYLASQSELATLRKFKVIT